MKTEPNTLPVQIPVPLHKKLKAYAMERGLKLGFVAAHAINIYLEARSKEKAA